MQEQKPFWYSATKVVFVALTIAFIAGFLMGKIEAKDFCYQVGIVFAFYFGQKHATAAIQQAQESKK